MKIYLAIIHMDLDQIEVAKTMEEAKNNIYKS